MNKRADTNAYHINTEKHQYTHTCIDVTSPLFSAIFQNSLKLEIRWSMIKCENKHKSFGYIASDFHLPRVEYLSLKLSLEWLEIRKVCSCMLHCSLHRTNKYVDDKV